MKKMTKHSIANGHILIVKALFNLTVSDISKIVGVNESTVKNWLINPDKRTYTRASDEAARKLVKMYSTELI